MATSRTVVSPPATNAMTETTPAPSSSSVVVMVVAVVVVGGARTIPLSVKLTTTIVVCAISWAIGWVHFWVTRLPLGGVAIVWRKATWRKATSLRKATLLLRRGCGVPFALIVITHLYTWLPPKENENDVAPLKSRKRKYLLFEQARPASTLLGIRRQLGRRTRTPCH